MNSFLPPEITTTVRMRHLSWQSWLLIYALLTLSWHGLTFSFYDYPAYRIGGAVLLVALINMARQKPSGRLPFIFLLSGVFIISVLTEYGLPTTSGTPTGLTAALITGVALLAQGYLGCLLIRHFANDAQIPDTLPRTLQFLLYAISLPVIVAAIIQAILEAFILSSHLMLDDSGRNVLVWSVQRFSAAILFSPLLLLWLAHPQADNPPLISRSFIAILLCGLMLAALIFLQANPAGRTLAGYSYLLIPFTLFAAIRLAVIQTLFILLCISLISFWADSYSAGQGRQALNSLLALSVFISINALTGWFIATLRHDREQVLKREKKISHLYEMLSRINQLLIRTPMDRQQLFSAASKIILEETGFRQVSVFYHDPAEKNQSPDHITMLKQQDDIVLSDQNKMIDCELVQATLSSGTSSLFQHCKECSHFHQCEYKPSKHCAGAAFPIKNNGQTTGSLLIFSGKPYTFTRHDIRLFQELADDIGFAVNMLDKNARLKQIVEVFEHSKESIIIADSKGTILNVNPAFTLITGYNRKEAIGQNPRILKSGRQNELFYKNLFYNLFKNGSWSGEFWNKKKNGDLYLQHGTLSTVTDEKGEIQHIIAIMEDITDQYNSQQRIHHLSNYDQLTGLPNRILLKDQFLYFSEKMQFSATPWTLLFIDLDKFKEINDALGHHTGDNLLLQVTRRLTTITRDSDIISRLGGDEFVVLTQNNNKHSSQLADKLIAGIRQTFSVENIDINIGASIGIAIYPQDGNNIEALIQAAETAMYKAKTAGGNRAIFFNSSMQKEVQHNLTMRKDLDKAIQEQEFLLYFQPKVTLKDNVITKVGYEALVRWQQPERGMISPADFIPMAEKTGQISAIDQWVLKKAISTLALWQARDPAKTLPVSVNLSALLFSDPALTSHLREYLDAAGVPPHLLELEITEHVAMLDVEYTLSTLTTLKNIGIRLSIDDFGTGYSSLSYLHQYPVDILKIDISFVRNVHQDKKKQSLIKAIISMAHALNLTTVAEGIECQQELALLQQMQCDQYQGYFFGRPQPEDNLGDG